MGRRKQSRPHRSGGIILDSHDTVNQAELDNRTPRRAEEAQKNVSSEDQPYFVEVDQSCWVSDEHLDISEVVLINLNLREGFFGQIVNLESYKNNKYSLRFRLCNVSGYIDRIKLGHWPLLSSADISLEFIENCRMEDTAPCSVILSGSFDGPDEGISCFVHLVSLKFITLRPILGVEISKDMTSLRMRVEMLKSAFDTCGSLLDNTRQVWKKSMMNVMAWLRPEVVTSEVRYKFSKSTQMEIDLHTETEETISNPKKGRFDAAGFYDAIKPSKAEPMLEEDLPDLLPELRPYQCRAVYWMVHREKGDSMNLAEFFSPLCLPMEFLDSCSKMFYNPFSGNVSLCADHCPSNVSGGILADEMGLGKTVELLACIFVHRKLAFERSIFSDADFQAAEEFKANLKRLKRERVECVCGAVSESYRYKGLWVQCDICDAWQHADCVGYSSKGKPVKSREQNHTRKKNAPNIVVRDGEHICQLCSELIQATDSPVATGATLIVCPAPILPQWHAEIMRHTRPGSLKTCIYDGVRETSISDKDVLDISELISADVVLTTYDVLKEDLSHDSDRHEGDRRFMRFQKRYPVIPTYLTRISWWRVCLDEAQMVESNATAATEMALRLHAKYRWCITGTPIQRKLDDLHGLLRFLKASPFDVSRWWIDVIRDPYERKDAAAMEYAHKFFKHIMWRSSKVHVADELQLPPQEECVSWLTFSPIEEHFYQRQHEACASVAHEVIESLKTDVLKRKMPGCLTSYASSGPFITHAEAGKLLNTLLKLRQACCHPQVGSSGLRSLQQSPMTMGEILMVLVSKTKVEGEESLRRLVLALNGLAGIAIIEKKFTEAVSIYKEALEIAEEHSEEFRLDPLLNVHIHHNLVDILPQVVNCLEECHIDEQQLPGISGEYSKMHSNGKRVQYVFKRRKVCKKEKIDIDAANLHNCASGLRDNSLNVDQKIDIPKASTNPFSCDSLLTTCENLKGKYLSAFRLKLSAAQEEFRKSFVQVSSAISERKNQETAWWMEALLHAEQSKDFSIELIRKIEEAITGTLNSSRSSRITSRFRSISGLKYHIQTGLDALETSRKVLLDQLIEIDQTMEKPREEDIERVSNCQNCQINGEGPACVMCELDELFQEYEARLFRLNKVHGGTISAEEAVDLQKKNSALNRFYWNLSQPNKTSSATTPGYEELKKRDVRDKVVASRSPSELEVVLGVIKNHCRAQLGREGISAANKQLHILEGMRKEFTHARSLAITQAQVLQAHDEIKMATMRLRVQESDDDRSLNALSKDELLSASIQYTNDKFMALSLLSCIKGKLRYLKGLVQAKHKSPLESVNSLVLNEEAVAATTSTYAKEQDEHVNEADDDTCPVCQEKLSTQKMVFQCGHITCCKCLFAITERRLVDDNKVQEKWVKCPTCRQHTDVGNIAYVDDRQSGLGNYSSQNTNQACEKSETSVMVQGSYGTKIEAVTRRILWIKSKDPNEKVLVFSSWNDVLDVLEHALAANDITFIRMKGGRKSHVAISEFRGQKSIVKQVSKKYANKPDQKSIQVLLLLIQHGANGLNLLEAQHVVLVEPLLNPAVEAQAISRVHRIGQKNRTLVHRFIVKDTVEESIYKLNRSRSSMAVISGNTKNLDEPFLTLKDVESLFAAAPSTATETDDKPTESLRHLPPSRAAAIAAERRLGMHTEDSP